MTVLRRTPERVVGLIAYIVIVFAVLILAIVSPPNVTLGGKIVVCLFLWLAAWLILLIRKARIVIDEQGLLVANWFVCWEIPWPAVAGVESGAEVRIKLADGTTVRPSIGGQSGAGQLRKNPWQRTIVAKITEYRRPAAGADGAQPTKRVDLALVPSLCTLVIFEALVVSIYFLSQ